METEFGVESLGHSLLRSLDGAVGRGTRPPECRWNPAGSPVRIIPKQLVHSFGNRRITESFFEKRQCWLRGRTPPHRDSDGLANDVRFRPFFALGRLFDLSLYFFRQINGRLGHAIHNTIR